MGLGSGDPQITSEAPETAPETAGTPDTAPDTTAAPVPAPADGGGVDDSAPGAGGGQEVTAPPPRAQTPEEAAPDDPAAEAAADPAGAITLKQPGDAASRRQTVGLLLPLSGAKAPLGESMLRAAELALFDVADADFELVVRDTKGTPGGAESAARAAVDAGANLLLGPVFSSSVRAVTSVAQGARVPVLAFSNNPAVAGPGVYVLGLMPQQQVRRVIGYAASQGKRHFAVLAPRNAYGELVVDALRAAVDRYGGRLAHTAFYEPGAQNVSAQVEAMADAGFGARPGSAVLLPAGGKQLQTIAPTFPFHDIDPDKVQFLGTALWNDPMLGTEPALVGGWFPAPPPDGQRRFRARYRETFAGPPGELASLAYDATALAALLARRNRGGAAEGPTIYTTERLTQRNGFAGMDGVFRLNEDGTVQRLYTIMEMQRKNLEMIAPAPESFQQLLN